MEVRWTWKLSRSRVRIWCVADRRCRELQEKMLGWMVRARVARHVVETALDHEELHDVDVTPAYRQMNRALWETWMAWHELIQAVLRKELELRKEGGR